jgi:hypothetical protein
LGAATADSITIEKAKKEYSFFIFNWLDIKSVRLFSLPSLINELNLKKVCDDDNFLKLFKKLVLKEAKKLPKA